MKKVFGLLCLFAVLSCVKNPADNQRLRFSEKDLVPLNDSTRALLYQDAANIELSQVMKDPGRRTTEVMLNAQNVQGFYQDLTTIYNHSFLVSNSFFEYAPRIRSFGAIALYRLFGTVDTTKSWVGNWLAGDSLTGIVGIDSLVLTYGLSVQSIRQFGDHYLFVLSSRVPLNHIALSAKLEQTGEFKDVSADGAVGDGSDIAFLESEIRIYEYSTGWGDCPAGCIFRHFWQVIVSGQEVYLLDEGGDPLVGD